MNLLLCCGSKEVDSSLCDTPLDAGQPIHVCVIEKAEICERKLETDKEVRTCRLVTLALDYEEEWYESDEMPDLGKYSDSEQDEDDEGEFEEDLWESSEEDQMADGCFDRPFTFLLERQYQARHFTKPGIDWENDVLIFPENPELLHSDFLEDIPLKAYGAYKRVAQKVHPIPGVVPEEARVRHSFPHNPLDTLPQLSPTPPKFVPTERLTAERMVDLNINPDNFLWPKEEKLFQQVLTFNEATLPYEEKDRGTLKKEYFSDYIMPTIPHTPWEYKNIPIPPGVRDRVIEMLKSKIEAVVYEPSQSSYRGRWFCVLKKNGGLRIVHDLQPLNKVSIRDASQLLIIDDFVESYGGRQCYMVFDLFWGFDARIVDPRSRDMTALYTPLGLLCLTALPMGYTNSPAKFQKCMTFILQEEIPEVANIFIDDLPIKGPRTQYLNKHGNPETLPENPGIRRFIWEHANDVHRIMHQIKCAGETFSPKKTQICR